MRGRHVLAHRSHHDETIVLAALRQERDAATDARRRRAMAIFLTANLHNALGAVGSEDRARDLRSPGTNKASEAHDLAGADVETHVLECTWTAQPAHAQNDRRVSRRNG